MNLKGLLAALVTSAIVPLASEAAVQDANLQRGLLPSSSVHSLGPDQINLFNGAVTVAIPLGQSYPLNEFSYGLTLSYSTNIWDYVERPEGTMTYTGVLPNQRSNAGLGWFVSFGELIDSWSALNPTNDVIWLDGGQAKHVFEGGALFGGPTHPDRSYTRDGTFMRMYRPNTGTWWAIEQPDGTILDLDLTDDEFLSTIRDRWGNVVWIDKGIEEDGDLRPYVKLTDTVGREQFIYFTEQYQYDVFNGWLKPMVDEVVVTAPGSQAASYRFEYQSVTLTRPVLLGADMDPNLSPTLSVPLLTALILPDGSRYSMTTAGGAPGYSVSKNGGCADSNCKDTSGMLTRMKLPTAGSVEWNYRIWQFNPVGLPSVELPLRGRSDGIAQRRSFTAGGDLFGQWDYSQSLTLDRYDAVTTVKHPASGDTYDPGQPYPADRRRITRHWFSTFTDALLYPPYPNNTGTLPCSAQGSLPASCWTEAEYGLQVTHRDTVATPHTDGTPEKRGLSSRLYECGVGQTDADSCSLVMSNYARYDSDHVTRQFSSRMVWADGDWTGSESAGWDGLGHFRSIEQTASGSWPSRSTFTNFNPQGIPSPADPWILGNYDFAVVTEGSESRKTQFCFDGAKGGLLRVRNMADESVPNLGTIARSEVAGSNRIAQILATNSPVDVVRDLQRDPTTGNVTLDLLYGGDSQPVGTGALCSMSLSGSFQYGDRFSYQSGALAKAEPVTGTAASPSPIGFASLDRTIDGATGLPDSERDSAGVETVWTRDAMGRVLTSQTDGGALHVHGYTPASGGIGPTVQTTSYPAGGGSPLGSRTVRFDGFGREIAAATKMPDGSMPEGQTVIDANGWTIETWAPGASVPTAFSGFDALGRPATATTPDAKTTEFTYDGVDRATVTVKRATALDGSGNVVETAAATTRTFDPAGRLASVEEPDGTITAYRYDYAGHVTKVCHGYFLATGGCVQERTFAYDGRGFLTSESHPEKTAAVTYASHDSKGNGGTKNDAGIVSSYEYDLAGRLSAVKDASARPLKKFTWDTASGFGNGKVHTAVRYNHDRFSSRAVRVTEAYTYQGRGGSLSARTTAIENVDAWENVQNFYAGLTQSFTTTELGSRESVTYPACGTPPCSGVGPARRVVSTWDDGWLQRMDKVSFLDVPVSNPLHTYVETISEHQITAGCGSGNFCVNDAVTRAQMAVFILKAIHGSGHVPPPATGGVFQDVTAGSFAAAWIEQLFNDEYVTATDLASDGCGPSQFCPGATVSRQIMAPILLRAKYGAQWTPCDPECPPHEEFFTDIGSTHPFALWIEQLARDQITAGCAPGLYCPGNPNTRGQMSVFLVKALSLAPAVTAYASNITYHPNGMIAQIAHGNGTSWNQTLAADGMARPGSIYTTGATQNWSSGNYLYDATGNIAKIGADHYFYDAAGRLTLGTADQSGGLSRRQRYQYDAYGNMTGMTTILDGVDPGTQGIGVNSTTNRLTAGTYDAAGNRLTTGTGQTYSWDGIGMMQSLTGSGQDWIYVYTADDERIWMLNRAASPDLGVWTVRDLDGSVLRQWVETGNYASDGIPVDSHTWTHDRDYVWRGGSLLASASTAGTRFFHLDHLGTPRLITDAAGGAERHDYWPFGEEITAPGSDRFKFTGHERDFSGGWGAASASDLDYMHARSYAPLLGRFLSTDPIGGTLGNPQGFNRYAYVMGDPVNYVDPFGLEPAQNHLAGGRDWPCTALFCVDAPGDEPRIGGQTFRQWVTQSRLEFALFKASRSNRMARMVHGENRLLAHSAISLQGYTAFLDGLLPFIDPFADTGVYPADDPGFISGQVAGEVTLATGAGIAGLRGAAHLSRYKALRFLNHNRFFRVGPGKWPGVQGRIPTVRIGTGNQWWSHWRF